MTDGLSELERRVTALDAEPDDHRLGGDLRADLIRFVSVLERITDTGTAVDAHVLPRLSASDADAIANKSRLLARLAGAAPEVVTGPLQYDCQYWVATGKPDFVPKGEPIPGEAHFTGMLDAPALAPSTKPFGVGLFTSTGVLGTRGMWRSYLDLNRGSTLFPMPWRTWVVEPRRGANVREIACAADWVDLVLSFPRREHGLLFPDWRAMTHRCDAVHMTLRAILATQGLCFASGQDILAALYWDVESTLWLRWCFDAVRLIETVP